MKLPARPVQIYGSFDPFEIRARKAGRGASHFPGKLFRHTFADGGAAIVGRPDGSITLKPKAGRRLWGMFPVDKKVKAVGTNEPFLDNPVLAVLGNPPGSTLASGASRRGHYGRVIPGRGTQRDKESNMKLLPSMGEVKSGVMDGAGVAAGLVGVPLLEGFLPLPVMLRTGAVRFFTRGALAYAAGRLAGMAFGRNFGRHVMIGGIAGAVAEASQELLGRSGLLGAPGGAPAGVAGLAAGYDRAVPIYLPEAFGGPGMNSYTGFGGGVASYTGTGALY